MVNRNDPTVDYKGILDLCAKHGISAYDIVNYFADGDLKKMAVGALRNDAVVDACYMFDVKSPDELMGIIDDSYENDYYYDSPGTEQEHKECKCKDNGKSKSEFSPADKDTMASIVCRNPNIPSNMKPMFMNEFDKNKYVAENVGKIVANTTLAVLDYITESAVMHTDGTLTCMCEIIDEMDD